MINSDAVLNVNCNVDIKCIDRHGHVFRDIHKHNKATVNMVDGLLKFLAGDFNQTTEKGNNPSYSKEALPYIPTRVQFGHVGVKLRTYDDDTKRYFDYVDSSEFIEPTFNTFSLQQPIDDSGYKFLNFGKVRQSVFIDPNNSQCLKMSLYIEPGRLVGRYEDDGQGGKTFVPYDWSYWNPNKGEYETMLTEAGLFSGGYGNILARVLFDGEVRYAEYKEEGKQTKRYPEFVRPNDPMNPITQSQTTTVVIEWRIGLVSIGDNDEFVTQNSLTTAQFNQKLTSWVVEDLVGKIKSDNPPSSAEIKSMVSKEIDSLLNNDVVPTTEN